MVHKFHLYLFLLFTWLGLMNVNAQDASKVKGKIIFEKENSHAIAGISRMQAQALRNNLGQIKSTLLGMPSLMSLTGYNSHVVYFMYLPDQGLPWLKLPEASLYFRLYPLYFEKGRLLDDPEKGSNLIININRFVYPETYLPALTELNNPEPVFFLMNGIKIDSSDKRDIILTIPGEFPVHILTNGRPLFIPYKQGQYQHFKIIRDQKFLNDAEKNFNNDQQGMDDIKKQIATYSKKGSLTNIEKMRYQIYTSDLKTIQSLVNQDEHSVNTLKDRLEKDQQQFKLMDKQSPAFINIQKKYALSEDHLIPALTTNNDPDGMELWTINPHYFNKNYPATAIQIITVTYMYYPEMTPEYMQSEVKKIFETIDYDKLKKLIKQ